MTKRRRPKTGNRMLETRENRGNLEFVRVEKDLEESLKDDSGIVDLDMRDREFSVKKKVVNVSEVAERQLPEYKGMGMFYRKFVSKLKNALK
ncbi:MAG: hypothetical protein FJY77_05000 [Candidatus Altiarchaeales archaeon]|nr:hypothetical protein [Candidatus Altiarchaeales archaeon]